MPTEAGGSLTGSGGGFVEGVSSQPIDFVVRPAGIEPTTLSLEGPPEANDINKDSM